MSGAGLPDGRALRRRMTLIDGLVSLPAVGVVCFYVASAMDLSSGEWTRFVGAIGIYAVVVTASGEGSSPSGAVHGSSQARRT